MKKANFLSRRLIQDDERSSKKKKFIVTPDFTYYGKSLKSVAYRVNERLMELKSMLAQTLL